MQKLINNIERIIILFIAVSLILFTLYPFVKMLFISIFADGLFDFRVGSKIIEAGGINILLNSVALGLLVSSIIVVLSVVIGVVYLSLGKKLQLVINGVFLLITISPPFVASLAYIKLFGRRGFITYHLLGLNIYPYGFLGVSLMQIISFISISALIIISYLNVLSKIEIDCARGLGAGYNFLLLDIIIPKLKPAIIMIFALAFVRSLADFTTPLIIGGRFETLASRAYLSYIAYGNIRESALINILLSLPSVIFLFIYLRFNRLSENIKKSASVESISHIKKGSMFYIFALVFTVVVLALVIQYGTIVLGAFSDYYKGKLYFTLEHFKEIHIYIEKVLLRSVVYSVIASFGASVIAFFIAYYIYIRDLKIFRVLDIIGALPYILPGSFFGIAYIVAFHKDPIAITGTTSIVIINLIFKQIAFSGKVFQMSMNKIERNQLLAAKDLGANEFFILKDMVIPKSLGAFVLSLISGFNASMTTVGSIIFLVTPSQKLLTLTMFDVINSGKYGEASVIAFIIIMVSLIFSILCYSVKSMLDRHKIRN